MDITKADTALVVIDPQNDVLSETGASWPLVGASVRENDTVENLDRLFRAAKQNGYGVFVSPHYLYPHDRGWRFGGPVEHMMLDGNEFFRPGQLSPAEAGVYKQSPPGTRNGAPQWTSTGMTPHWSSSTRRTTC